MGTIAVLFLILVLMAVSAAASGLMVGLMSLNIFELKRKCELKDAEALLVYPLRARGTEMVVSLTIINVFANTCVAVLLYSMSSGDGFFAGLFSVLIATVLIALFSNILPQAFFKKNGLKVAARFAPYIKSVLEVMRPVSKRLANFIDKAAGNMTPDIQSADELMMILEEHEVSEDSQIESEELMIVKNALKFGDKQVRDVMTPESVIKALDADQKFTLGVLKELQESGHSRFPVYEGDISNIVGILYLRDLISNHNENLTAVQAADGHVTFVNEKQPLGHVLNGFIKTKKHLFIVVNEFEETVGLITVEDILEEIIGKEIIDEFDKFDDMREVARLKAQKRKRNHIGGAIK